MTFACLLAQYRMRAGIAQNALARLTGINVGTVNRLEYGERLPATREQVINIAVALFCTQYETDQLLHAAGMICTACPMARYVRTSAVAKKSKQEKEPVK